MWKLIADGLCSGTLITMYVLILRLSLLAVSIAWLPGCTHEAPIDDRDGMRTRNLRSTDLTDGRSHDKDIFARIGPPDLQEGNLAIYSWDKIKLDTSVPDWGNHRRPGGEPEAVIRRFLILEFNEAGLLNRHARRQYDSSREDLPILSEVLRDWRQGGSVTTRLHN